MTECSADSPFELRVIRRSFWEFCRRLCLDPNSQMPHDFLFSSGQCAGPRVRGEITNFSQTPRANANHS